jgi:hypothetical protein
LILQEIIQLGSWDCEDFNFFTILQIRLESHPLQSYEKTGMAFKPENGGCRACKYSIQVRCLTVNNQGQAFFCIPVERGHEIF